MTIEAGVVIALDGSVIHWHLPPNRSVGFLPDSRPLWDVLWDNRERLAGFAHSHPGGGHPGPSWEDITTFAAIESGLGRRLEWWITSSDQMISIHWIGPGKHDYAGTDVDNLHWVPKLKELSGMIDELPTGE